MQSWHIHIEGRVQGVGFRPFIYRLANAMNIKGEVANTSNGVHIHLVASKVVLDEFIERIRKEAPSASRIVEINYKLKEDKDYESFTIIESHKKTTAKLLITPDIALCPKCKKELLDRNNKRFNYPFTTCTQCGPRYSVMRQLPYDRKTTTMKPFVMCTTCDEEYADVNNRRFYSQTNSCPDCGVNLKWITDAPGDVEPISHAISLLKKGAIVAVKGIGGFLLLVDATNKKAIKTLRKRKNRPSKPFACLFKNIEKVKSYAKVNSKESELLGSAEAPIVLLKIKKSTKDLAFEAIAPGLSTIGAMLPYAPILEMIASKMEVPLVATSANVSGSPIIYKDDDALRLLGGIADAILSNDRQITFPQDDSVVAISPKYQKLVMMRRSRGYAPSLTIPEGRLPNNILAMGAEMKSAFGFTSDGNTYLSQYLGDTSKFESQEAYDYTFKNLTEMMNPEIECVLVDSHPNYNVTQKGIKWANNHERPFIKVQHHKAHFAAVLEEHNLLAQGDPVLGVVWDGTGYGDDHNMWGGEFFRLKNNAISRIHHLGYMPVIGGNRMALEPSVATIAAMWPEMPGKVWMRKRFSPVEQGVLPQLAENAQIYTSSVGRLFDAAAGLLCKKRKNTFEGEAAMALQELAQKSKLAHWDPYCLSLRKNTLNPQYLLSNIDLDKKNQVPVEDLALRFHQTLVQWIAFVSDINMIHKIAFSGGVFQNTLLVDMIFERLGSRHDLYFHNILPPNDENIALGQLAMCKFESSDKNQRNQTQKPKETKCA